MVFVGLLSSLVDFRAFSFGLVLNTLIVSVFVLSSISRGSFNSECFLWYVFIYLLVPSSCGFVLVFLSS